VPPFQARPGLLLTPGRSSFGLVALKTVLQAFEDLTREIEQDKIRLAEKEARLTSLREKLQAMLANGSATVPLESASTPGPKTTQPGTPSEAPTLWERLDAARSKPDPLSWEAIRGSPPIPQALVEVAKALADLGGSASGQDIAKKLDRPVTAVAVRLSRATKLGIITRVQQGFYALPSR
jgi:hypothetical protein